MGDKPSWPAVVKTTLRLWWERRGLRIGRRGAAGLVVLLVAGLVAALCVVLIARPGTTSASVAAPGTSVTASAGTEPAEAGPSGKPADPAELREEALLRGRAAQWVARQVSPAAIVSCDPAMCTALQAAGVPSSQLLVLLLADADPLGSDVVIATPSVRSQFGARLNTVYAPEVIASFGSGVTRIDIRAIAPEGGAAFESARPASDAARISAGRQLLRNKRISVSKQARAALTAGDVDPRLLVTLAGLLAEHRVSVLSFGDASPGAPDVPLRGVEIRVATRAEQRAVLSFLRAQRAPYLPDVAKAVPAKNGSAKNGSAGDGSATNGSATTRSTASGSVTNGSATSGSAKNKSAKNKTAASFTIEIEYDAPGPLGMNT